MFRVRVRRARPRRGALLLGLEPLLAFAAAFFLLMAAIRRHGGAGRAPGWSVLLWSISIVWLLTDPFDAWAFRDF